MLTGRQLALMVMSFLCLLNLNFVSHYASANTTSLSPEDRKIYLEAFLAVKENRWGQARILASKATSPVLAKVVEWTYLRYGEPLPSANAQNEFIIQNPNWPHLSRLRVRAEIVISKQSSDQEILQFGDSYPPRTGKGRMRYGEALISTGEKTKGQLWIRRAWTENKFSKNDVDKYAKKFAPILRFKDHQARIDRIIWRFRKSKAMAMVKYLSNEDRAVANARIALHRGQSTALDKLKNVATHRHADPGLIYEQIRWHRRRQDNDKASILLNKAIGKLGPAPYKWWQERHILIRRAINDLEFQKAFDLARQHRQNIGTKGYAEAEWLAGWIALRFLSEPEVASRHFTLFNKAVETPVSRARGAYWLGRAAEVNNKTLAGEWFEKGTTYPTAYYGQMSFEAMGQKSRWQPPTTFNTKKAAIATFNGKELVQVIRLLYELGESKRADSFLYHLTSKALTPIERWLVADLARQVERPNVSVRLSKQARRHHISLGRAGFPTVKLPNNKLEPALAYALIRQESEFRAEAISPAGARGLMQLMPATARQVAKNIGVKYRKSRLLEADYNMSMGTHYLRQMLDKYNGSYIMAIAAYNAGDHRVDQWIKSNGDPRTTDVDAIDWIERIPFGETRNYVQRVMENLQIYRALANKGPAKLALQQDLNRGT